MGRYRQAHDQGEVVVFAPAEVGARRVFLDEVELETAAAHIPETGDDEEGPDFAPLFEHLDELAATHGNPVAGTHVIEYSRAAGIFHGSKGVVRIPAADEHFDFDPEAYEGNFVVWEQQIPAL